MLFPVVGRRTDAPWALELAGVEGEVERPSCDAAAVAAARGVAGMQTVAPDTEDRYTPVAFAPGLGRTYAHVDHGFVMTRQMLENLIGGYGTLLVGMVFAACGQPPLDRVLLEKLVSLSSQLW